MFRWFTSKFRAQRNAQQFYGSIVAQSRSPEFYTRFAVSDSLEGRFEMICIHMFIVLQAFRKHGEKGEAFGEGLVETFFQDLDDNLREMGVGDLTVPKKMRNFADAFYGRVNAYDAALKAGDSGDLQRAVSRNVYGCDFEELEPSTKSACENLSSYIADSAQEVSSWSFDRLMSVKDVSGKFIDISR